MYHQADSGDHDQHHYRNRVEQDAQVECQCLRKRKPFEVIRNERGERSVRQAGSRKVLYGRDVRKYGHRYQYQRANGARCPVAHPLASYSCCQEGEEGEKKDQNCIFHNLSVVVYYTMFILQEVCSAYHFNSSRFFPCILRILR